MVEISPTGWFAVCDGREVPVERFSEDGDAMVVSDERTGRLVRARDVPGYEQIIRRGRYVSVVAETAGWRVGGKDDGVAWEEPVVAWLIRDDGTGVPLIKSDGDREIETAGFIGEPYELLRPDDPSTLPKDQ